MHLSPLKNWCNDPNGLVFFNGKYHAFYQFNPEGNNWGHMSWAHAVSTDLIHWENQPLAIPEGNEMIFSGSIVVDQENLAGFGKNAFIAIYTADYHGTKQTQDLAYSIDG